MTAGCRRQGAGSPPTPPMFRPAALPSVATAGASGQLLRNRFQLFIPRTLQPINVTPSSPWFDYRRLTSRSLLYSYRVSLPLESVFLVPTHHDSRKLPFKDSQPHTLFGCRVRRTAIGLFSVTTIAIDEIHVLSLTRSQNLVK